jgi:hypothetical protein
MSLGLLTIFVLFEWLLLWLIGLTILKDADPESYTVKLLAWTKQLSVLAILAMWTIHVLTEVGSFAVRHLPRRQGP